MNEFMIHVERIVRPILAKDGRKDRMREELLAHLEAAFEQERTRQPDEGTARGMAIASLGDPAQLRTELQESVSRREQRNARMERTFCWQAPEPAWRYTLRVSFWTALAVIMPFVLVASAIQVFLLRNGPALVGLGVIVCVGVLSSLIAFAIGLLYFKVAAWQNALRFGLSTTFVLILFFILVTFAIGVFSDDPPFKGMRLIIFMTVLTGLNVFALGFLYFKIRDNLLGAFGRPRSWLRAAGFLLASAVVVECTFLLFLWTMTGNLTEDLDLHLWQSLVAIVLPVTGAVVAWFRGPSELRHTQWELLDIQEGSPQCALGE